MPSLPTFARFVIAILPLAVLAAIAFHQADPTPVPTGAAAHAQRADTRSATILLTHGDLESLLEAVTGSAVAQFG